LLLDEIGDMPVGTQAKLLRVLEEGRCADWLAKGDGTGCPGARLYNKNLKDAIARGTFREDLFFRLNVFEVQLPPLRERKQDIARLASELVGDLNRKHTCK